MRLTLRRVEQGDHGTFGRLVLPDGQALFTGELPWRDNAPSVSRIPAGVYPCAWTMSPRFRRRMYLVEGVPGRAGIRFHAANLMGDAALGLRCQLNGCVALGEKLGAIEGQRALLLSAPAIGRFERALGGQSFELEVVDGFSE